MSQSREPSNATPSVETTEGPARQAGLEAPIGGKRSPAAAARRLIRRRSLRGRMNVVIVAVMSVAFSVFAAVTIYYQNEEVRTLIEQKKPLLLLVARSSVDEVDLRTKLLIKSAVPPEQLQAVAAKFQVAHLIVLDETGGLLAANDPELAGSLSRPAVEGREIYAAKSLDREEFLTLVYPIRLADGLPVLGYLEVVAPLTDIYQARAYTLATTLGMGLVLIALVVASLDLLLRRMVVAPIAGTSRALAQFGKGRHDQRVALDTDDEIGELARQFNQMADELGASREELERKIAETTRDLSALYAMISPINRAANLREVLDDVAAKIRDVAGADGVAIQMRDDETGQVAISACHGILEETISAPVATGFPDTGTAYISEDLNRDTGRGRESPLRNSDFRSAAVLPLKTSRKAFGSIILASRAVGRLNARQTELFTAIASQISVAVENARLYEDTERRRREAEELAQVARTLTESLKLEAVATRVVEGVRWLLSIADATVFQLQPDRSLLALAVSGRSDDLSQPGFVIPAGTGVAGRAVATGRPASSVDILNDPEVVLAEIDHRLALAGSRSVLAVPLRSKGEIIGVLSLADEVGRVFTEAEVSLVRAFADQAALAMENARLYADATRRQREAESLAEVGRHISQSLDPQEVRQQIVDSIHSLFQIQVAGLFQLDPESGALLPLARSGDPGGIDVTQPLPHRVGLPGLAVSERRPVTSPDHLNDPRLFFTPEVRASYERATFRSALSVPLLIKDQVIGALSMGDRLGRVFTAEEMRLAQAFADQAALAIENARLYSESARRQRTAETLAELGRLITRSLDPQEVQDQIVDSVRALFRFHNAVLFQLEPATEDLTAIAMAGDFFQLVQGLAPSAEQSDSSITNSASRKFYTLPKGIGIAGLAVRERSVVTTENILADPRIELTPQMQRAFQQASICSSLSAPLIVKDRVIGALSFGDRESRAFTTEEIQLAQAFADQAALALENARLFEEATQQRHEAEELANVARTLTGSLDLSAVGARIAEAVHRLFGVAAVAVWQKREDGSLLLLGVGGSSPDTYPPGYCMPWGQGVAGRVVIENRPIYSEDALNDPNIDLPEGYHRFADSGIHAIQAMPLHAKGELVGVLAMADKHGRIFSAAEKTLLQTCADQAALAIENARLYTDAMRRQREAESLAEVGRHISLLQEPQKVQQQIVESVRSLLHTKVAALFRLDSESGNLFVMATSGDHGSLDLTQPLPARAGVSGLAVVERRPVASSDILSDPKLIFPPEVRANYERSPIRASLSVPLIVKEQVIGALTQSDTAGRVYTPEEIQLAQAFADQAALAMENARLFSDATRRQREAEELAEVARTLTESLDPHAVAERIAEGVQRLLDVGSAGVFERLPHNSLRALAVSGVAGELYPPDYLIPVGSGVAGQAVEKGEMVFSADVINDPGIIPTEVHERFAAVGSGAMLATPLHSKGKIIGALIVSDRVGRVFTDAEISLFRTLADHAAVAMENARLYGVATRRQREAESLAELGRHISQSLDPQEVKQQIVNSVRALFQTRVSALFRLDPDSDALLVLARSGEFGGVDPNLQLPHRAGLSGLAVSERRPVASSDILNDPRLSFTPEARADYERAPFRSALAVPLIIKEQVVGVLSVGDRLGRVFTDEEKQLAQAFADQAAMALENARLFEETTVRRRVAEALLDIGQAVGSTLKLKQVLKVIAQRTAQAINAERCALQLLRGEELVPVMGQFADGHSDPALWAKLKAMRTYKLEETPAHAQAIRTRRPVAVEDTTTSSLIPASWIETFGISSALVVPLVHQDQVIGTLVAERTGGPSLWRQEQINLAMAIANQAALALENARLFEESRRLVEDLKALTQELGVKNRELDTFVYTVSHDLKAPLVTLQGMAELLMDGYGQALDEQGQHFLDRLKANARQMEQLILDLLALSRIGREGHSAETVPLREVVDGVLLEWGGRIRAKGISVICHELPVLWGLRTQVEQVMSNLIGNAVKYSGEPAEPVIEIGAKDAAGEGGDAMVECYVRDNGIGIDPAYHEKVFEIFQRLKETESEGTGVGLAIVKKIVEGAGGRIWVESARGQGATFRFTWPKAPGAHRNESA